MIIFLYYIISCKVNKPENKSIDISYKKSWNLRPPCQTSRAQFYPKENTAATQTQDSWFSQIRKPS